MVKLIDIATQAPSHADKQDIIHKTNELVEKIGDLQHILQAQKKHSLLVILQGMDGSGKDGTTSAVFSHCTPGAVHVQAFKKPTEEELSRDFLWRVHRHTPAKGIVQIFNRSHYEDILIQWVRSWIDDEKRAKRMQAINAFEDLLQFDNGTVILKFYLHISKSRQKEKLKERITDPKKQWKHSDGDWEERKKWDKYMEAYEYAINQSKIPWHIIPADHSWYRNYLVAEVVWQALSHLDLTLPKIDSQKFL